MDDQRQIDIVEFERDVTEALEAGVALSRRDWARQAVGLRADLDKMTSDRDFWAETAADYKRQYNELFRHGT